MVWRMRLFIIRHLKKQYNAELHEVDDGHQGVGCYAWLNLHPPTLHGLHPLTYIGNWIGYFIKGRGIGRTIQTGMAVGAQI